MKRVAALLTMLVVISTANPVMEIALSEIQTAPDSLERIEFHMYSGLGGGHDDLSGAQVITNAGTAVIDSGMVLTADNYLVVDRSNTTGTFSLGDDSDYIRIQFPGEPEPIFSLRYPANPFRAYDASWTPPPGASASIFQWWEWQNGEWFDYYTWYVDETPTFGERNDDTLGGISGYVRDDRGLPVDGAAVRMTSSQGTAAMTSGLISYWPAGYFEEKPTGPGTFTVTAECPGYLPGAYPDLIVLAPNELREIVITLDRVGVAEEKKLSPTRISLHSVDRTLVLESDRPGSAELVIRDNLGRTRLSTSLRLTPGSNKVFLRSLPAGVYFAGCSAGGRISTTKLALY